MGVPDVDTGLVVAVVLAGGGGRRMGGVDKAGLLVGGDTLLDRVLGAAAGVAGRLVVVGPPRAVATERAVIFLQEDPLGGGPVPAVAAALDAAGGASVVLVLAVDLPLLSTADLARLVDALSDADADAAAAADPSGRPNPLLAAYRADVLRDNAHAGTAGAPASSLLPPRVSVVDLGPTATLNVNTPADLERANDLNPPLPRRRVVARRPMVSGPANFADEYASALGRAAMADISLAPDDVDTLLDLARVVAHGTERRFAPLVSYLAGQYVIARTNQGATVRQALDEAVDVANRVLAARPGLPDLGDERHQ